METGNALKNKNNPTKQQKHHTAHNGSYNRAEIAK